MNAPRQALNPATTSVGLAVKLVTVQAVSADGKTAVAVDRQNTQVSMPMMLQRSKGQLPAVGETWLASQDLGSWTFSAFVGQSASDFASDSSAAGVYTGAVAPENPQEGELWINSALGNSITTWDGTRWVPLQLGAPAIQQGSLTSAQLSEQAGIAASQVDFTASDIGGHTTTLSATAPADPSFGDLWYNAEQGYQLNQWTGSEWTPYQWGTQSIAAEAVTAELIAANTITAEQIAAGIVIAGVIDGTFVDAATFIGSVFEGTDFVINTDGAFFYSGTPASGNLIASITNAQVTDTFGNVAPAGVSAMNGGITVSLSSGALLLTPITTGYAPGSVTSFTGTLILSSPTETNTDLIGQMLVVSGSAYAAASAPMVVGPAEIKVTVPVVADTWHGIVLDSGWTPGPQAPQVRVLPDGNVQVRGQATHSSVTAVTYLNQSNPVSSKYQPALTRYYRAGDPTDTAGPVQVNADGTFQVRASSSFPATQVLLDGIYSL
jgi:hypothetical protein